MKVCLNGRVGENYLKKADEIKIRYKDMKVLNDMILDYPDKTFIIEIPTDDIDWDSICNSNKLGKGNII